ncbi:response regulator [Terasakiella sp.]|uniref:response regulator n=1 Tax=Terasakiella sp. TaxID=2034861 RepID=UPI003AA9762E
MRVLLVEDEKGLGQAIKEHVADEGHAVDWFMTLVDASASLATTQYDLILLDLMLPDGRGIDFLKTLRRSGGQVGVIILTALDQISDRIEGLNAGADDYLVKPFDLGELSARITAMQRRLNMTGPVALKIGELSIEIDHKLISCGEQAIDLSAREWAVLERLLRKKDAIVSKVQIENCLYEYGAEVESNTVEVYISRLRKKIGKKYIETLRGVGYRFKVTDDEIK